MRIKQKRLETKQKRLETNQNKHLVARQYNINNFTQSDILYAAKAKNLIPVRVNNSNKIMKFLNEKSMKCFGFSYDNLHNKFLEQKINYDQASSIDEKKNILIGFHQEIYG